MKLARGIYGLLAVVAGSAISGSLAQQSSEAPLQAGPVVKGSQGNKTIQALYVSSDRDARLAVGRAWFTLVSQTASRDDMVMVPLQPFDPFPPARKSVMERLGQPEKQETLRVPGDLKVSPGVMMTKSEFDLECLWYGALGMCFLPSGMSDEKVFALAYDPKQERP